MVNSNERNKITKIDMDLRVQILDNDLDPTTDDLMIVWTDGKALDRVINAMGTASSDPHHLFGC